MKTTLLVFLLLFCSVVAFGQTAILFDGTAYGPSVTAWSWGQSTMDIEAGAGPAGGNAIRWVQGDEWANGWTGIGFSVDPPFNLKDLWAVASLTITMKCDPGVDSLRVQYVSPAGKIGHFFHPVADSQWHTYAFPLREMVFMETSTAFYSDTITTVDLMAEQDAHAGKAIYITDWYVTTGPSLVLFDGVKLPPSIAMWTWGASTAEVITGAGPLPGTNAIKWTHGDSSAQGFGFTVDPPYNLADVWATDSVKITIKAEAGVDTATFMLYSGGNTVYNGTKLALIADNQWHQYAFPLSGMVSLGGSGFDPSKIAYAEVNTGTYDGGHAATGKSIYFTNWWTGNPVFDVVPPAAPTGLSVTPGTFTNTITWSDVPGESGERYNVYYSLTPITDVKQADVVKLKIKDNQQQITHDLFAPGTDQSVGFYYGITCTDAAGNESPVATFGPVTNTAKGMATISPTAPPSFVADGDLSEWAAIPPLHRAPSDGSKYVVSWGEPFKNDADLTFDCYIAVDNTYLYVAFDVKDDVVSTSDPATNQQDSPDFHIGLYNWHGAPHSGTFLRGATPDYLIRFAKSRALIDLIENGDSLLVPGPDYAWVEGYPTGYTIEARIRWTALAARAGDSVFVPVEGDRIPLDIMFNDADSLGYRESMLELSPYSDANSWWDPSVWVYTWIGNRWNPVAGVADQANLAATYSLLQNYPNPFNPATQITYSLAKAGMVTINVYDILGRLVNTVVNEHQNAGVHTVKFTGSSLSSGVYFYRINAGSYTSTKKMLLMK